jgi:hypothetical protein
MGNEIELATRAIEHWLRANDIEPDKITVILRCQDERTKWQLEGSLLRWLDGLRLGITISPTKGAAEFLMNGIKVRVLTE